jgi:hypothetical protein
VRAKSIILPQTKKVPVERLNISGSSSDTTYLLLAITLAIQIEGLLLLKSPSKQINIYISLQLCIRNIDTMSNMQFVFWRS